MQQPLRQKLIEKAKEILKNSGDGINGLAHAQRIEKNFLQYLSNHPEIDKEIDRDSMMVAIFWHDVWKAQHFREHCKIIINLWTEGYFTARMFSNFAKSIGFEAENSREIVRIIRRHSLPFCIRRTLEEKIFYDLDGHDSANPERQKEIFKLPRYYRIIRKIVGKFQHFYFEDIT